MTYNKKVLNRVNSYIYSLKKVVLTSAWAILLVYKIT
jgi:hypothetical protein